MLIFIFPKPALLVRRTTWCSSVSLSGRAWQKIEPHALPYSGVACDQIQYSGFASLAGPKFQWRKTLRFPLRSSKLHGLEGPCVTLFGSNWRAALPSIAQLASVIFM